MTDILYITGNISQCDSIFKELSGVVNHIEQCTEESFLKKKNISAKAVFYPVQLAQIQDEQFSRIVDKVLQKFNQAGGLSFRFYLYPLNFSPAMFTTMIDDRHYESLDRLTDVVHIEPSCSLEELKQHIRIFLKTRAEVRRFHMYRTMEALFLLLLGIAAKIVSVCAFILIYAWFMIKTKWIPEVTMPENFSDILSIAAGIAAAPALIYLQFMIRHRGVRLADSINRSNEFNIDVVYKILIFMGCGYTIYFYYVTPINILLVFGYILFGVVVNAATRQYYEGIRVLTLKAMKAEAHTKHESHLPKSLLLNNTSVIHRFRRIPLFSSGDSVPRIFCSYTHSSDWAKLKVRELYNELSNHRIDCFVDKYGIAPGSSWRHQLRQSMVDADYVICFCDKISIQKPWPASELETAVRLRKISSKPNIIAITPKDLDDTAYRKLPIFEQLYVNEGEPMRFVKVARESGDFIELFSKHSIVLQEDFQDTVISGNKPILLFIPYIFWKLSALLSLLFRYAIVPASFIGLLMYLLHGTTVGLMPADSITALISLISTSVQGSMLNLGVYIFAGAAVNAVTETIYRGIVTKSARRLPKRVIVSGIAFSLVQMMYVAAFLLFLPVLMHLTINGYLLLFVSVFMSCSGVKQRYLGLLNNGKRDLCDNFLSGYRNSSDNKVKPNTFEFGFEQNMALAARNKALHAFYNYIRDYRKVNHTNQITDSMVSGLSLYGTASTNTKLQQSYDSILMIEKKLCKCGFSHNLAVIYDDLGEIAAFLGRYNEALTFYERKCECYYASLYSNYESYSEIYTTYYRMAWICKLKGDIFEANFYAAYALKGINKNLMLMDRHIADVYRGIKRINILTILGRTIFNRSLTIGFKEMIHKNRELRDEIRRKGF